MESDATLRKQIFELETRLQQGECRHSRSELERLLSEQFMEFGSTGTYDRDTMINELLSEGPLTFSMADFQVISLSANVALATYRATMITSDEEPARHSLRSSVWKREGNYWQMIFHQGTPTPAIDQ